MAECASLGGCPFFNDKMAGMDETAKLLKRRYCLGDPAQCARFMVATRLGKAAVPADLFPSMTARAQEILKAA